MGDTYNIYCDESCHMERDRKRAMILGALLCPVSEVSNTASKIALIKAKHGVPKDFEIKWTKVSASKVEFYLELVSLFFTTRHLSFRAVIADKTELNHEKYNQTHDTWYYKMYYVLLEKMIESGNCYNIYLDIKDTRSALKTRALHEVLCNRFYDFQCDSICRIQNVESKHVVLLQLADLLIGILSSNANNPGSTNLGKKQLIETFQRRTRNDLNRNTKPWDRKANWLVWPKGVL